MALRVEFEDGESSEVLIYSGVTIEAPCEPIGGYQPITVKSLGTPTPFQVTTEPDSLVKNGRTRMIKGRFQTITVMDIYSDKSIDELRFQDYEYKNVNQGDGEATLKPFSAGNASTAYKPASFTSSTCQPDPSTCWTLPWAFPAHMGSDATPSSGVKSVPGFIFSESIEQNQKKFRTVRRQKQIRSKKSSPEISSNACKNSSLEVPSGAGAFDFALTPSVSFKSESVPDTVLSPPQHPAVGKKLLLTLTVSEGQQLRDGLLQNIVKCMQIQNSLYRLVLLKLQARVIVASDEQTGPQCSAASDLPKVPSVGRLNDAAEASSKECMEMRPDSSKAPSTVNSGEKQSDFSKAAIKESTVDGLKYVPEDFYSLGKASVYSPDVELNNAVKTFGIDSCRESVNDSSTELLCEIKEPLEALVHCADIQRSLCQNLLTVDVITNEGTVNDSSGKRRELYKQEINEDQVDMLEIQSKLEKITLKTKLECNYVRNPYSSQHLKRSTSVDVLQHVSVRKRPFSLGSDGDFASVRELPHGRGTLKTTSDELLYSGDWCRGQRHGKGEGLIFSLSDGSHSTAQHGFYIGGWKNNMRHGCGKMLFSSGAVYEGQWKFDRMTGYGTLNLPDGTIKEGTWKDGSLHGCAVFIWPHGVTEYREYDACRGQLSSCIIEKETVETLSRMSAIHSQLLKVRDCVTDLRLENRFVTEQLNALNEENAEMFTKLHTFALEIRKSYEEQWERETQNQRVDLEKALKAAEESQSSAEETAKLKKELEETKGALMCQICFTRPRDCIILPCSHLLYCRVCVNEHKSRGGLRCPACRGTINSEILCNVNHSSENLS